MLLDAETQLAGTATAADGSFSLKVPAGRYRLTIQYLGYETLTRDVDTPGDLGEFVLHPASVEMQEVVVKTSLVRREADRFVMEIAGSPVALGKDGTELLKQAPGVWLTDDKIAINGASGVKVYINDREVRMSTEQLLNYLRGLKSEEIQRIEVIPQAGCRLRRPDSAGRHHPHHAPPPARQRAHGRPFVLDAPEPADRRLQPLAFAQRPRRTLDLQRFGLGERRARCMSRKPPNTPNTVRVAHCSTPPPKCRGRDNCGGGRAGAIFDISERHSIGAEADFYIDRDRSPNRSSTDFREAERLTRNESLYDGSERVNTFSATFNYIWRIDTLGSTLKVMADYSRNNRRHGNDSFVRSTAAGIVRDSTYDDRTRGLYNVARSTPHSKSDSARRGSCAPARSTPTTTCTTKRSTATSAPRGGRRSTRTATSPTIPNTSRPPTPPRR